MSAEYAGRHRAIVRFDFRQVIVSYGPPLTGRVYERIPLSRLGYTDAERRRLQP